MRFCHLCSLVFFTNDCLIDIFDRDKTNKQHSVASRSEKVQLTLIGSPLRAFQ